MEKQVYENECELGIFGLVASQQSQGPDSSRSPDSSHELRPDVPLSPEHKATLARMAANMIIEEEPRGSYFVRNPGAY